MDLSFHKIHHENLGEVLPLLQEAVQGCFSPKVLKFRLTQMLSYDDYRCWSVCQGDRKIGVFGLWELNKSYEVDHLYVQKSDVYTDIKEPVLQHIESFIVDVKNQNFRTEECLHNA